MTEGKQSVSTKQVREVVALGKKQSKTAFPNPTRGGCPKPSTLRAMAHRDRRLSLKDLPISHIVNCSPCFQEYARLRRRSVVVRGIQGTVGSLVVLAVLFAAVRFVWNYTRRSSEPNISQQRPTRAWCGDSAGCGPFCPACDDCRPGFLLTDPRRGDQPFAESDTPAAEIPSRPLSPARGHGTGRIRSPVEGFCGKGAQRHSGSGANERRHHFARGGFRFHCCAPRSVQLDDSSTGSELADLSRSS